MNYTTNLFKITILILIFTNLGWSIIPGWSKECKEVTYQDLKLPNNITSYNMPRSIDVSHKFNLPKGSILVKASGVNVNAGLSTTKPARFKVNNTHYTTFNISGTRKVYINARHGGAINKGVYDQIFVANGSHYTFTSSLQSRLVSSKSGNPYYVRNTSNKKIHNNQDFYWLSTTPQTYIKFHSTQTNRLNSSISLGLCPVAENLNVAPVVTITEDTNNDGKITSNELSGKMDVKITVPKGTKVGDTLTITNPNGSKKNVPITQTIITYGYTTSYAAVFGQKMIIKATIKNSNGKVSPQGIDSAIIYERPLGWSKGCQEITYQDLKLSNNITSYNMPRSIDVSHKFNLPKGSILVKANGVNINTGRSTTKAAKFKVDNTHYTTFTISGTRKVYINARHGGTINKGIYDQIFVANGSHYTFTSSLQSGLVAKKYRKQYYVKNASNNKIHNNQDFYWLSTTPQNYIKFHSTKTNRLNSSISLGLCPVAKPTAPSAPEITSMAGNSSDNVTTENHKPTISGTCKAGLTVTVQVDGKNIAPTTQCKANGTFSMVPTTAIVDGTHKVTATQVGSNGIVSEKSPTDTLTISTATVPDYDIALSIDPTIVGKGSTNIHISLVFTENNTGANTDTIRVSIPKDTKLKITYDSSNKEWKMIETAKQYELQYIGNGGKYPPHTRKHIQLSGIFTTPKNKKGSFPLVVKVEKGNGETNLNNNEDSDTITYNGITK